MQSVLYRTVRSTVPVHPLYHCGDDGPAIAPCSVRIAGSRFGRCPYPYPPPIYCARFFPNPHYRSRLRGLYGYQSRLILPWVVLFFRALRRTLLFWVFSPAYCIPRISPNRGRGEGGRRTRNLGSYLAIKSQAALCLTLVIAGSAYSAAHFR